MQSHERGEAPLASWWLLAWFLLYLLVTYFKCHPTYMPSQHQLQSPESYHALPTYYLCTVRVKSKYACVSLQFA